MAQAVVGTCPRARGRVTAGMATSRVFPFRFTPAYRLAGLPFGVTSTTTQVEIVDRELLVRFGPWRVRTPVGNVVGTAMVTGPFSLLKTAGPAHLSFSDRGMTCATNGEGALCVRFAEPVRGIEPFGLLRHPAVTLTVADCRGLARVLNRQRRLHPRR